MEYLNYLYDNILANEVGAFSVTGPTYLSTLVPRVCAVIPMYSDAH